MKWLDKLIDERIAVRADEIYTRVIEGVIELDPANSYMLIIPESISEEALQSALDRYEGKTNLLLLRADNVTLLTLT